MSNKKNKFNIKIPDDISVIFHKKKKTLIFKGYLKQKLLKLNLKIFINKQKKFLYISPITFSKISNYEKKKIKTLRNNTLAWVKQTLIETSILIYKKLKIKGVGYRILITETFNKKLLTLKLGYSHFLYFRIPNDITVHCFTKSKLSIFGNSYHDVSQVASLIRTNKLPDPYKGKGVLYENEIVNLKEGKKV